MFVRAALLALVATVTPATAAAEGSVCAMLNVPMAERQVVSCLDELTTAGTVPSGHTVAADWAGLTHVGLPQLVGVPGIQIDGYFPDTSTTNANHGWNHDAQFVLRLPERWNGGLVVSGTPGNRRQYANDRAISDFVLSKGYAYAATDKGNTGTTFYQDGRRPGDAVAEWHWRFTQLAIAAKAVVAQRYGRLPARTIAAGISNGGYLVRWQLENNPWLFDGGVDWEGTLWRADGPNLFTFLPAALRNYPAYAAGDQDAHDRMLAAGYPPGSEFLWPYHNQVYWELTHRIYCAEFDPTSTCGADYDYASRPPEVKRAVSRIALTGRIGKPLITLQGTLDTLLPISETGDVYAAMIRDKRLHRYHRIENGTHADGLVDVYPDRLVPMAPEFQKAVNELERWLG